MDTLWGPVCLSQFLFVCLRLILSVCVSVCVCVCLFVSVIVCLSVCLHPSQSVAIECGFGKMDEVYGRMRACVCERASERASERKRERKREHSVCMSCKPSKMQLPACILLRPPSPRYSSSSSIFPPPYRSFSSPESFSSSSPFSSLITPLFETPLAFFSALLEFCKPGIAPDWHLLDKDDK